MKSKIFLKKIVGFRMHERTRRDLINYNRISFPSLAAKLNRELLQEKRKNIMVWEGNGCGCWDS